MFEYGAYGIDASVTITRTVAPDFTGLTEMLGFQKTLRDDLLSVTVSNGIDQPYGTFCLELLPRPVLGPGTTWADAIEPYSLVTIALQKYGGDASCTAEPVPVMLGLVDYAELTEDYGAPQPRRTVRIVGRSLSAILTDARWWHHWYLADGKQSELLDDFRRFFAKGVAPDQKRDETAVRALGAFGIDPRLFDETISMHPTAAMRVLYDFYVGAEKPGFIKLAFGDGRQLGVRLQFDADGAAASSYDQRLRLTRQVLPSSMPEASCWQVLNHFCERPFTEFFSETIGSGVSDARAVLVCRKPPWLGHIIYEDLQPRVTYSSGRRPTAGESLFDTTYGGWDIAADTVELSGLEILHRSLRRGLGEQIFNGYEVLPALASLAGNTNSDRILQRNIPPLIDEDPASPSYVARYGMRPMPPIRSKYVALVGPDGSTPIIASASAQAQAHELLLREWFHRNPAMYAGTYVTNGRTDLRAGTRLVDTDINREFYVQSVCHRMVLHGAQPSYTVTAQVSRGWDLK